MVTIGLVETPVLATDVAGGLEAVVAMTDVGRGLLGEERVGTPLLDGLREVLVATDEVMVTELEMLEVERSLEDDVAAEDEEVVATEDEEVVAAEEVVSAEVAEEEKDVKLWNKVGEWRVHCARNTYVEEVVDNDVGLLL